MRFPTVLRCLTLLLVCMALNGCEDEFTLRVIIDPAGTGTGKATSSEGIDCPGVCAADVEFDASVGLIAVPDPGSVFISWTGSGCGDGQFPQVNFQMTGDVTCTVRFDADPALALLTITHDPTGTGSGTVTGPQIDCGADCTGSYPFTTGVALAVTPDAGSVFSGWGIDCGFLGTNQNPTLTMDNHKDCTVKFDAVATGGILTGRGSFTFDHRVEVGRFNATTFWSGGFDNAQGHIIDASNPDNLTSPAGAEYSVCPGARGMTSFFDPRPPYNADILYTTCVGIREGTTTLTTGGFSQVVFYTFAPGEALLRQGTSWLGITDFEFGKLHLQEQVAVPAPEIVINLTNPLERSCPFSLAIEGSVAYVVGREGTAGTSTANCDNWRGMWRVDLTSNTVLGFTPFGTQPRIPVYFNNFVYVSDFAEDKIYVINAATGALDHSIDVVGDGPTGFVIEDRVGQPDRMHVTNWNTNLVTVIDLSTEQVVDTEPSGGVAPVKAFLQGSTLLVLNFGNAATTTGAVLKAFTIQ